MTEEYMCPHKAALFITIKQIIAAIIYGGLFWLFTKNFYYAKIVFGIVNMTGLPLSIIHFFLVIRRNKNLGLTEKEGK